MSDGGNYNLLQWILSVSYHFKLNEVKLPSFELESKNAILENTVNELKVAHRTHL